MQSNRSPCVKPTRQARSNRPDLLKRLPQAASAHLLEASRGAQPYDGRWLREIGLTKRSGRPGDRQGTTGASAPHPRPNEPTNRSRCPGSFRRYCFDRCPFGPVDPAGPRSLKIPRRLRSCGQSRRPQLLIGPNAPRSTVVPTARRPAGHQMPQVVAMKRLSNGVKKLLRFDELFCRA